MSLLGIDVGTAGCKAAAFSQTGEALSLAYEEYDTRRPAPGRAELDVGEVWRKICRVMKAAAHGAGRDSVRAVSISSFGEAVVPVAADGRVLGASILNFDMRGEEYMPLLREKTPAEELYRINGNILANWYTLPKLLWIRDHDPRLYEDTALFLHWGSFAAFKLGAEPAIDYSLANRSLLFDLDSASWSGTLAGRAGVDTGKLPRPVPSATVIGLVSHEAAGETGLPAGIPIAAGAHDQCANAVGSGAIAEGTAMCGMGSFFCIAPVFNRRPEAGLMIRRGLNTEHHAAPGLFVSFLYNQGGMLLRWFRDTFALLDRDLARRRGQDIYELLLREIPRTAGNLVVIPRFAPTGPPDFASGGEGAIFGISLETTRGDILRATLEGVVFSVRELVESIAEAGVEIRELRATGGGSKSDAWVGICADALGKPVARPQVTEAGCLGAAVMAGVGCGAFGGFSEGVEAMVRLGDRIEPREDIRKAYDESYRRYRKIRSVLSGLRMSL